MPRSRRKQQQPPRIVENIVVRAIAELKVNPRNSRKHSDAQIGQIAASIERFGFTMPVMIDGEGLIIAGHGRVLGAQKLGMAAVPTIDGSYLSADERRAYVIADNQIALNSEWDADLLADELSSLSEAEFDLDVLGFDDAALKKLLGDEEETAPRGRAEGQTIVQYNIVFDDMDQQKAWFALLRDLRQRYPELETIGGRLARFIEDTNAHAEPG